MKKRSDKKSRRKNYVYSGFLDGWSFIKSSKNFLWIALVIFVITSAIGYFFPIFFEKQVYELIQELIKQTQGMNTLELIGFIIFNNVKSAFFAVLFGIILGLVPFGMIAVNGYVLGFVANKTAASQGVLILWRLLPHGILEIPAIVMSVGLGIRLGMFLFICKGKNKKKIFIEWIKNALKSFIFIIIPLLVIAGIIEGSLIVLLG